MTKKRGTGMSARRRPAQGRTRWPVVAAGAVAVAVVAVLAVVWAAGGARPETGSGSGAGERLEHIHGLGVDPADGALYAATHHGVFRLAGDGAATRVGEGQQDTMGFTIAGPRHFLASGHPAPGEGGPDHLGLVESTDAGVTWTTLSLPGQADFHALRFRHGMVYGLNSVTGQLMASRDKTTWESRSTLGPRDLAVSPTDPQLLLATTASGPVRSTDGGRTWTPAGGPVLALIDWQNTDRLWGVATHRRRAALRRRRRLLDQNRTGQRDPGRVHRRRGRPVPGHRGRTDPAQRRPGRHLGHPLPRGQWQPVAHRLDQTILLGPAGVREAERIARLRRPGKRRSWTFCGTGLSRSPWGRCSPVCASSGTWAYNTC